MNSLRFALIAAFALSATGSPGQDSRFAHSDGNARFLHWIDLYDADNRKITPDSDRPYSSQKTCGRCHDYETISHGWHFNAFMPEAVAGRQSEPWIWTDARTGIQLPLSYRDWSQTIHPKTLGITNWQMTKQFGGRLPGGTFTSPPLRLEASKAESEEKEAPGEEEAAESESAEDEAEQEASDSESEGDVGGDAVPPAEASEPPIDRWPLTGSLEIDCMICHAVSGAYDFNTRRDQIEQENFAWAATAALRLGTIDGNVSRIKDDADPDDDATKEKLPKVSYDASRFSQDGTVFMDLIREPESNACYQCHSSRTVSSSGIESRWIHDEDVHLRAGMVCADCHRNGIDHHIVRGFEGEANPSGESVATLSCTGCHLGIEDGKTDSVVSDDIYSRPGRLGSPKPMHVGLPPIHFEKMSCTSCHGGPAPRDEALRMMTSLSHGLGSKDHRSGFELPVIVGPVFARGDDGKVYPHRAMWPAYWGLYEAGSLQAIAPERVYEITRRALRVRSNFIDELLKPKLSSTDLKEILGEDRAKVDPSEWSEEERANVDDLQASQGRALFEEKVYAALEAIEKELTAEQAVYVSSGIVYARGEKPDTLEEIKLDDDSATSMIRWPIAHNVRPAGWSLGAGGCVECHSETGNIFASTVSPSGPGPEAGRAMSMAALQGVRADQRLAWNELFRNRGSFKYIVGGSIVILLMTLMIGIGAVASRFAGRGNMVKR